MPDVELVRVLCDLTPTNDYMPRFINGVEIPNWQDSPQMHDSTTVGMLVFECQAP